MNAAIIVRTHIIEKFIFQELSKFDNLGMDVYLNIDNHKGILNISGSNLQNLVFYGRTVKCIITTTKDFQDMDLPFVVYNTNINDLGEIIWYNGDYVAYVIANLINKYDYFWFFDYDCFLNGNSYGKFFNNFKNSTSDYIASSIEKSHKGWSWHEKSEWIYKGIIKYKSFLPVFRLSKCAIDFLYKRRREHYIFFKKSKDNNKRWIFSELFIPTEVYHNGGTIENIKEHRMRYNPQYDLSLNRIFNEPDYLIYHPVKGDFSKLIQESEEKYQYVKNENIELRKGILNTIISCYNDITIYDFVVKYDEKNYQYSYLEIPNLSMRTHYELIIRETSIDICLHFEGSASSIGKNLFKKVYIPDFNGSKIFKREFLYGYEIGLSLAKDSNFKLVAKALLFLINNTFMYVYM